jgi:CRP-like cAMP-binding protein
MKVAGLFRNAESTRTVPSGTVIFKEGDSGEEMYGVVEGEVSLTTSHGVVYKLGPDETFGEMSVVDSSPRMATAVAVTETKLAVIDRRMFLFLIHETPTFALQVMSSMAERLRAHG